ncbi:MAG TPA: AzlC family ABC transporter permease [Alphaproteobacteria bacterium]|nr:AzlC family ABC transporter permease [Alphaproteobacteria bacterium]
MSGGAAPDFKIDHGSPRGAFRAGMREAFGAPLLVLCASYVGFGSLVRESGLSLWAGLLSTLSTWALPGQIVSVELYAVGASLVTIFIAVALTNARMMPMTMTLLPLVRLPGRKPWRLYAAAHLIAVTGWAVAMLRCPHMPAGQRLSYFVGFAGVLLSGSVAATAAGFLLSGAVPPAVSLGLVFVNPIYFMLLFIGDVRDRGRVLALALGAILAPLFHIVAPTWGLLITGVVAGGLAFALKRVWRRHG